MLHIILLLLKIIGILLLCVLGLILLILLTTLFVPIRYRVAAKHGEDIFYLKGRIHWLLHIVHLNVSHIEGQLHIQARLFGFLIYDNLKPKKPKESRKKKINKKSLKKKTDKMKTTKKKASSESTITTNAADHADRKNTSAERASKTSNASITEHGIATVQTQKEIEKTEIERTENERTETAIETTENIKSSQENSAFTARDRRERKSILRKLLERIRSIRDKIVSTFLKWKERIRQVCSTVSSFRFKLDLISKFLRDELNKEGMHLTFSSLKKLLKHVLPTKLKSRLTFGTGDPCSTGQALGAMSILYSFYGDRIQIIPDFERNILEGEHFAKGRIRLVTILIIVVKLILDKRFKQLKNNFIILKEAL